MFELWIGAEETWDVGVEANVCSGEVEIREGWEGSEGFGGRRNRCLLARGDCEGGGDVPGGNEESKMSEVKGDR